MVAILVGAKIFTPAEIRAIWGLDPATEKQAEEILKWLKATGEASGAGMSAERVLANENEKGGGTGEGEKTADQQSQGQRDRNEFARGDRLKGEQI